MVGKKAGIFVFLAFLAIGVIGQSQNNACNAVSFIEDGFSVGPLEKKLVFFRIKNNFHEDFFVDFVGLEKNQFFSSEETIVDKKIFAFNSGRTGALVQGFVFEKQQPVKTNVFVTGHFSSGNRCFLEKDFLFLVKPVKKMFFPETFSKSLPVKIVIDTVSQDKQNVFFDSIPAFSISSFSSKIGFLNGKAKPWIVIKNNTGFLQEIFVELKNLPLEIFSFPKKETFLPNESKQVFLEVNGTTRLEKFKAIFSLNGINQTNRLIEFENKNFNPQTSNNKQPVQPEPIATQNSFFASTFSVFSQNAFGVALLVILVVLIAFFFSTRKKRGEKKW